MNFNDDKDYDKIIWKDYSDEYDETSWENAINSWDDLHNKQKKKECIHYYIDELISLITNENYLDGIHKDDLIISFIELGYKYPSNVSLKDAKEILIDFARDDIEEVLSKYMNLYTKKERQKFIKDWPFYRIECGYFTNEYLDDDDFLYNIWYDDGEDAKYARSYWKPINFFSGYSSDSKNKRKMWVHLYLDFLIEVSNNFKELKNSNDLDDEDWDDLKNYCVALGRNYPYFENDVNKLNTIWEWIQTDIDKLLLNELNIPRSKIENFIENWDDYKQDFDYLNDDEDEDDNTNSKDNKNDNRKIEAKNSHCPIETKINSSIKFSDIAGLDEAKKAFNEKIILPIKHQELFKEYNKKVGGGILLYGLPGTGKTMFAEAAANEINAAFYSIKCSDIKSKWYGESENKVKDLFKKARKNKISIIFMDEFEAIGSKRTNDDSNANNDLVPEILAQIQGVDTKSVNILVIIAATNRPWSIDSAFMRPGRLDEKIYVPLPDFAARKFLFENHIKKIPHENINFDYLAKITEGNNGADIVNFCEKLKMEIINKSIKSNKKESLTMDEVFIVEKNHHSSVNQEDIYMLQEFQKKYHNK